MQQNFPLPQSLQNLLARIQSAGFLAYAVGGCVRDSLLGRPMNDWDVTTNAHPEEIKNIFADCRTIDTGIQHGTVTVMYEGDTYEVTVFRVDGEYTDGRHPDQVKFTASLEEDLARRDFTVNAMAYSPTEGIVDPFGGVDDLKNGILRAVGDPTRRFTEDALRILRGVRFASTLGFAIEEQTAKAMIDLSHRLALVSRERILTELSKAVLGSSAHPVLSLYHSVVSQAWEMLSSEEQYFEGLSLFPHLPYDLEIRMAALLSPLPDTVTPAALLSLRFSRETATIIADLVKEFHRPLPISTYEEKCLLGKYGVSFCQKLTSLWKAKCQINGETPTEIDKISHRIQKMAEQNLCVTLSTLAVSGKDIQTLGITDGKAVGDTLRHLLQKVMQDELENDKQALLGYLRQRQSSKTSF